MTQVDSPTLPVDDPRIISLAKGPGRIARSYGGYVGNGYRFQTKAHSVNRATNNSGVCIKGHVFGTNEDDYFGVIDEILEIQYASPTLKRIIVFNCTWFETTRRGGVRKIDHLQIVEVNKSKHMRTADRFVLASQAIQVYYLNYPINRRDLTDWLVVCKVKPRQVEENLSEKDDHVEEAVAFQEDEIRCRAIDDGQNASTVRLLNNGTITLHDDDTNASTSHARDIDAEFIRDDESDEETEEEEDFM